MQIIYKILAGGVLAAASAGQGGSGDDASKMKPISMLQGHDTLIEYPLARMIPDAKMWTELWTIHKGISGVASASGGIANGDATPPPKVDFDKNQVFILFGGQCPNVQAYDYIRTDVVSNRAVIRLGPNFFPNANPVVMMTPYIMLVLPKLKVGIDIDLETVAKDGTRGVNRIASFNPPKDSAAKAGGS